MQPIERRVFCALAASEQRLSREDLFEGAYGGQENGGPEWSSRAIWLRIHRMRQTCGVLGLRIDGRYGWGWRLVEAEVREAAE